MEIRSNRWTDCLSGVASGDNVGSEFGAFQPVDELFWAESPQVAQSICGDWPGIEKDWRWPGVPRSAQIVSP